MTLTARTADKRPAPVRIQRSRRKGWRKPDNAIYVGRPSRWGNPFIVGVYGTVQEVLALYRLAIDGELLENPGYLEPLRGKDLACWCNLDAACHADILLELANQRPYTGG